MISALTDEVVDDLTDRLQFENDSENPVEHALVKHAFVIEPDTETVTIKTGVSSK